MRTLLLTLAAAALFAADDVPSWVREAAALTAPEYSPKVTAVVLLQEEQLIVDAGGRRVMRERGAVRILQQSSGSVRAYRPYNSRSGSIRDFQGWIIPPAGKAAALRKNLVVDQALATDALYSEYRAKVLDPGTLAPGSVFAWEVTEEERTVFTQYRFAFQNAAPVLVSRFILTLPTGWEVKSEVMNAPRFEPAVAGNTYTWELRDLPWIEREDYGQGTRVLAPWLGVTYYPPDGSRAGLRPLADWPAVSAWLAGFVDPPAAVTPAIRAKAAELTAGAATELEKIRAIAAFAQQTNYVAVDMNLTRGGGYSPHPADQVLTNNYGDCKDKTTLVRALLAAAGIESFATVIYSGERRYVRPEWPSPHLFNHMIVTARASADTTLPVVFEHPRLGRLLPFDPTDSSTPLGDLPRDEQGSRALIITGDQGDLVTMPLLPPAANRVESVTEGTYSGGALEAKVVRHYFGQPAANIRYVSRSRDKNEFKRSFEAGLSRRLGGLTLSQIEPSDNMDEDSLRLDMKLSVKQFGELMQGRLLVITPGSLVPPPGYSFSTPERKSPIELMGGVREDLVTIALPASFALDEIPDPVDVKTSFASYEANWGYQGGKLAFRHRLEIRDTLVPAADYADVRRFFETVASAHMSAVVLLSR